MVIEQSEPKRADETRAVRAARHAALADVSRLAIVDSLAVSDLAPVEVGRLLALPSNLVAHHVKVLREAGLIRQVRSEGDRRRTYLQLIPGAVSSLALDAEVSGERIVFVCRGNSARSQLAAALWRERSSIPVASAGTRPADRLHEGTIAVARRRRLPLKGATTSRLEDVRRSDDLLIAVCDEAHEALLASDRKVLHWSIPDPVRTGEDAAFDAAYDLIEERVHRATTPTPTEALS